MHAIRRDLLATALTALAALAGVAALAGWDVAPVGGSVRWGAAVLLVLGMAACATGARVTSSSDMGAVSSALGGACLVLALLAVVFAWEAALLGAVVALLALWALTTLRHAGLGMPHRHHPAV
jgi:hypothetical protein